MSLANVAYIGGLVRILMAWGGGYLVQKGLVTEGEIEGLVGAAVLLVTGAWSIWAKRKAIMATPPGKVVSMLALCACGLFLSGCTAVYTPKLSAISWGLESAQVLQGLNVTRYQTGETNDYYEIILDSSTGEQSSVKAVEGVIALGELIARSRGLPLSVASAGVVPNPCGTGAADGDSAYSSDVAEDSSNGYAGAPGDSGVGVYGKPTCSRCMAYRSAHPGVEIINIEVAGNSAALWSALRARGYVGTSIGLPVVINAAGFIQSAR